MRKNRENMPAHGHEPAFHIPFAGPNLIRFKGYFSAFFGTPSELGRKLKQVQKYVNRTPVTGSFGLPGRFFKKISIYSNIYIKFVASNAGAGGKIILFPTSIKVKRLR
jgi:hypothetical protein